MGANILVISYLLASVLFVMGLKKLSDPKMARSGNLWAGVGMGLAILATILFHTKDGAPIGNIPWVIAAMGVGTVIGWFMAVKVKMTAMPQMVSFFNGMGGACAAVISLMEYSHINPNETGMVFTVVAGLVIGSVSFSGSMIAFGKLDGWISDPRISWFKYINMLLMVGMIAVGAYIVTLGSINPTILYGLCAVALLYGILFVMPIGGADMPVVISLLNSFTGVAAAFGGFLYDNQAMLTGGILVGSAGTILTILMTQAMNRSLLNVIVGSFGGGGAAGAQGDGTEKVVKEISPADAAVLLSYSQKVSIIPGYGLAVAQAQHVCHEVETLLEDKGVEVSYAIHPVAGRMPGHMNVLMAEADVPYAKLREMDDANPEMPNTDVVIVIGANDVVNPAADDDPSSPIYGMPIIKALDAKNVIVMKRSMAAGYAGIGNDLFFNEKTRMLFGDAKDSLQKLAAEIKEN